MRVEDVETVAWIATLDYDNDPEKGYREAKEHTLDHLKIVPQHCNVVENDDKQVFAAMVLHPQEEVFEIEDFHTEKIQRNKEALALLKSKLMEYLENVQTEILCCLRLHKNCNSVTTELSTFLSGWSYGLRLFCFVAFSHSFKANHKLC